MPIDKLKLNRIHNELKELAGDHGSFIFAVDRGHGDEDSAFEVRSHGPVVRVWGLLSILSQYGAEILQDQLDGLIKRVPREPD